MKATKNNLNLPLPRLELNWEMVGDDWSERVCHYFLVLPVDELDIRSNSDDECGAYDEWRVSVGETMVSGSNKKPVNGGVVDTPLRDSAHIQMDSVSLGCIPMFAVCGDDFTKIAKIAM